MQTVRRLSLPVALAALVGFGGARLTAPNGPGTVASVRFSPKGGCTELAVGRIDAAKESILVQAYSFTSEPIAAALIRAHKRGVKVRIVLDRSQRTAHGGMAKECSDAGIEVTFDPHHAIAHNKVIVIDGGTVLTGSFNFTGNAESSNAENLIALDDRRLAALYAANWQRHRDHSEP